MRKATQEIELSFKEQQGIIVGCDANQEWLLPWWWNHYSKCNKYPVAFIDFGMTSEGIVFCKERGSYLPLGTIPLQEKRIGSLKKRTAWEQHYSPALWRHRMICFKKPFALLRSPFSLSIWIDLDCQVQKNLEPLFNCLGFGAEIALCREPEETDQLHLKKGFIRPQQVNYNSGVIAFRNKANVVQQWAREVELRNDRYIFDQQALSELLLLGRTPFVELPCLFNWSRAQGCNDQAYIQHYHGGVLKGLIRDQEKGLVS